MSSDINYLRQAYEIATLSKDPSTQNGALLIHRDGNIVVADYNRFPVGVTVTDERMQRPLKYEMIEHAERNALYVAARKGIKTLGLTMYCPWFACSSCSRAIIQCGIKEVVGHDLEAHYMRTDWKASSDIAMTMLKEAGVKTRLVKGKIGGGVSIRFDGKLIEV